MNEPRVPVRAETLPIRNRRRHAMTLRLEPWGDEYLVAPGETVQLRVRGPEGDVLDVEPSERRVVVYAWPGSIVTVHRRGRELAPPRGRERLTAPWLPKGMRTREWVAGMAG